MICTHRVNPVAGFHASWSLCPPSGACYFAPNICPFQPMRHLAPSGSAQALCVCCCALGPRRWLRRFAGAAPICTLVGEGRGCRLTAFVDLTAFERCDRRHRSAVRQRFIFWTTHPRNAFERWPDRRVCVCVLLRAALLVIASRSAINGGLWSKPPILCQAGGRPDVSTLRAMPALRVFAGILQDSLGYASILRLNASKDDPWKM